MDDPVADTNVLIQQYLRSAIDNARSALVMLGEPATEEAAYNYVLLSLARMSTE